MLKYLSPYKRKVALRKYFSKCNLHNIWQKMERLPNFHMAMHLLRVRSWHGVEFDIKIINQNWAKLGILPPHPQLVNLIIRKGLDRNKNIQMQILHELGHVQAFPFVFLYYLPLYSSAKLININSWIISTIGLFFFWEIIAEIYVFLKYDDYISAYTDSTIFYVVLFWIIALFFVVLPFL